ncbi:hypothetical protein [Streptomyces nigra]|uniref:hypothetical protein n=1 Tax=Streptomyces nigra TaxID=1827580 RepID=UPI003714F68E
MEEPAHFNREVSPERRMHAKGFGPHGPLPTGEGLTTSAHLSDLPCPRPSSWPASKETAGHRPRSA